MNAAPASKPKFTTESIIGDKEELNALVARIKKRIEKENRKLIAPPVVGTYPGKVWDLTFPPKRTIPTEDDMKILGVTGEIAWQSLVTYNDLNRPVDLEKVIQYASDMVTGQWHGYSHQGLGFTWEPMLQDGQHRMLATYLASLIVPGIIVTFHVFFNRDPAARNKIDIGRNRTSADKLVMNLKIRKNASFDNNKYANIPSKTIYSVVSNIPSCKYLNEDAKLNFAEQHIELIAEMLQVLMSVRGIRLHAAWAGVFVDATLHFGKDIILPLAKRFAINDWDHQDHESRVDPLFSLHNRLADDKSKGSKLTAPTICSMTFFAIRKALLGELVSYSKNSKGNRQEARFTKFTQSEVEDYKKNKDKSKVLRKNSVSREERRKKDEQADDSILDETGELLV